MFLERGERGVLLESETTVGGPDANGTVGVGGGEARGGGRRHGDVGDGGLAGDGGDDDDAVGGVGAGGEVEGGDGGLGRLEVDVGEEDAVADGGDELGAGEPADARGEGVALGHGRDGDLEEGLLVDGVVGGDDLLDEEVAVDAEGGDDVVLRAGAETHVSDLLRVAAEERAHRGVLVKHADLTRAEAVADVARVHGDLAKLPAIGRAERGRGRAPNVRGARRERDETSRGYRERGSRTSSRERGSGARRRARKIPDCCFSAGGIRGPHAPRTHLSAYSVTYIVMGETSS